MRDEGSIPSGSTNYLDIPPSPVYNPPMANRVNKIRVKTHRMDGDGNYHRAMFNHFFTPAAAAVFIAERVGTSVSLSFAERFVSVSIGNDNGWTEYPIDVTKSSAVIVDALVHAKEIHLAFYHDGESEFLGDNR